jgi:3-hydroxyisobutyrate dehydrogenase
LTIMCGSDDEAVFQRAKEAIAPYSRACERLGKAGAGQLAKNGQSNLYCRNRARSG